VSALHPDGFGNLFLGALAGCGPVSVLADPGYHDGGPASFAGRQAANVALAAMGRGHAGRARARLVTGIEGCGGGHWPQPAAGAKVRRALQRGSPAPRRQSPARRWSTGAQVGRGAAAAF
jgi:hypothetical protein